MAISRTLPADYQPDGSQILIALNHFHSQAGMNCFARAGSHTLKISVRHANPPNDDQDNHWAGETYAGDPGGRCLIVIETPAYRGVYQCSARDIYCDRDGNLRDYEPDIFGKPTDPALPHGDVTPAHRYSA